MGGEEIIQEKLCRAACPWVGGDKIRKENRKTEGKFAFFYLQREGSQEQRQK